MGNATSPGQYTSAYINIEATSSRRQQRATETSCTELLPIPRTQHVCGIACLFVSHGGAVLTRNSWPQRGKSYCALALLLKTILMTSFCFVSVDQPRCYPRASFLFPWPYCPFSHGLPRRSSVFTLNFTLPKGHTDGRCPTFKRVRSTMPPKE